MIVQHGALKSAAPALADSQLISYSLRGQLRYQSRYAARSRMAYV